MTTFADSAIDLRNVTKRYGGSRAGSMALRDVSLRVDRGQVFGLLGPNGAGKSTLIKIMMTVVRPTAAAGTLLGRPVGHKPTLAKVGYLPEHHRFPRYLTGRQTLEFFGALSRVDRRTRKRKSAELIDVVGMTGRADEKVGTFSKGMMQRIGIAAALVNDPDLILLDEPTDGVDPVGRRDIRDLVGRLAAEGKTVFLNSHLLGELEMVCHRVAMLVDGQVVRLGTVDELTAGRRRYEIDVAFQVEAAMIESSAIRLVSNVPALRPDPTGFTRGYLPSGAPVQVVGHTVQIGTEDAADVQVVVDVARAAGLTVTRVQAMRPSLEDLFIEAVEPVTSPPPAVPPLLPMGRKI